MPSQSKDPFEAAALGDPDTPPDSPVAPNLETRATTAAGDDDDETTGRSAAGRMNSSVGLATGGGKGKEEDEEEEEANMLGKFPSGDPDKVTKMQAILSQFTEEQMSRYESFRRSGFQKANMKKLLASLTGSPKISVPMTIVVSGIAKMFVGELVEMARIVMTERKESGPIRPSHIREAYRRLKLDGKVPKRSVPRLFR